VTFTATFGFGVVTVGHFGPGDDAACGEITPTAGHSRLQVEAARPAPPATHCPFCHWQRSVSGATVASLVDVVSPLESVGALSPAPNRSTRSTALDSQSPRGPPA
jgi:hypothetical protein